MKKAVRSYLKILFICSLVMAGSGGRAPAQEVFRNPAMEDQDPFQQSFNKGRALMRQGRLGDAIKEFNNAAKLREGKCADCFFMIGQIQFAAQEFKDAAKSFRQAAELKPQDEAHLLNWLGVALYRQDDKKVLAEAITAFNRAIELSGGKITKAYLNLGYSLINGGREEEGVAALKTYLEKEPAADDAHAARAVIANPKMAGASFAPAFKVASTDGGELSLAKLKGKVVLLDFWATWCGPCRVEMPQVKRIWKKYGGDSFVIVGVNMDRNRNIFDSYVKHEELTWPQYYDGLGWGNKIAQLYGVHSIPQTFLIDGHGIIRAAGLHGGELANKIDELLRELKKQSPESAKSN
jgi:thiol-disulfide isomerase/thioredoxin/lipoprotein NlpI